VIAAVLMGRRKSQVPSNSMSSPAATIRGRLPGRPTQRISPARSLNTTMVIRSAPVARGRRSRHRSRFDYRRHLDGISGAVFVFSTDRRIFMPSRSWVTSLTRSGEPLGGLIVAAAAGRRYSRQG
jgi:hypothetical protein